MKPLHDAIASVTAHAANIDTHAETCHEAARAKLAEALRDADAQWRAARPQQ